MQSKGLMKTLSIFFFFFAKIKNHFVSLKLTSVWKAV